MPFSPEKPIVSPERLGPKGDGICRDRRGTIYVERSAPLDQLKIKVFEDSAGVKRGEILEIVKASPHRQNPPCPHYHQCGNCTLLHLKTDYYRKWKTETVQEAFLKLGIKPQTWLEPIFLGGHNRRRATFSVLKKRGKVKMGYYKRRSKELTEIESCEIADPVMLEFKKQIKPFLSFLTQEGEPLDLFAQWVDGKMDLVITGPLGKHGKPNRAFVETLKDALEVSQVSRVSWKSESKIQVLIQKEPIETKFGSISVELPPGAFLQPTLEGEKALVSAVMKALPTAGKFADLFSGCGTFTGPMLERGSVEAFEFYEPAVASLSRAARENNLGVYKRDLFKNPLRHQDLSKFDAIVFDPPRAGCPEQAHELALSKCPTLIGVSCNPATFARDSKIILKGGYKLKSLQVVDQFLGSHHVEIVGVFKKTK